MNIKNIFVISVLMLVFGSCSSSKKAYLERSDADKALQDAVRKLNKDRDNEEALQAVPELYKNIKTNRLAKIDALKTTKDISRFDKIIDEYEMLQDAYNAVVNQPAAFKLVNPESFSVQLAETKEAAAEEYYQAGLAALSREGRDNAKKAYTFFRRTSRYVSNYKQADRKMEEAFDKAVVDVVVHPVDDRSRIFNSTWGNYGSRYSREYFEESLIRDLGNRNYPARVYSVEDAWREKLKDTWEVMLTLRDLNIPYPYTSTTRRNASAQVEVGRDTSGRPVYNTVYATLNITRRSFTAEAEMNVSILDSKANKYIAQSSLREDYRWQDEIATYSGDSRALSSADWALINNNQMNTPRKEEILEELYRKLYPRVRSYVSGKIDW